MGASILIRGRLKPGNKTRAQWTDENPVLLDGEMVYESDTGRRKVGNGASTYSTLTGDVIEKAWRDSVQERVEERLRGTPPKTGTGKPANSHMTAIREAMGFKYKPIIKHKEGASEICQTP